MPKTFCVKLSTKLYTALRAKALARNISRSEHVRDLIRRDAEVVDTGWESGYAEGKIAGYRQAQKKIGLALADE